MAGRKDGGEGLGEDSTGTTVKLHGLEDKSHLNGRIGCVVKALPGNRYQVNLAAGPAGDEKMVSVKGKNLRILQTYTMMVYLVKHGRVNFPLPQVLSACCTASSCAAYRDCLLLAGAAACC